MRKDIRIVHCGIEQVANGESAKAGSASELINMREREQALEVVGEPQVMAQLMPGDKVLLVDDDRTLVLRGNMLMWQGDVVLSASCAVLAAHRVGRLLVVVTEQGNEVLLRTATGYSKLDVASAIPDENVLGFDVYMVNTYEEEDLRNRVACSRLKIKSVKEIEDDEEAMQKYNRYMYELEMKADYEVSGETVHGIEHYLPKDVYQQEIHHKEVAKHIMSKFELLSHGYKFHAMLATQNIPEAIAYWKIFKEQYPSCS